MSVRLRLPKEIITIATVAQRMGGRVFLVGGPVRDSLIGYLSPDWDLAVDLRQPTANSRQPTAKLKKFLAETARQLPARFVFHTRFLTATIELKNSDLPKRIDISHTRQEFYPHPGSLPIVKPASIEEDLYRRDFTINAMAVELTPPSAFRLSPSAFRLIDPYNGQGDLSRRLIRIIHPESFILDPTRIFRGIRFAIRLGYEIESGTLYLLRKTVREKYPALLTPERVLYELRCIVKEKEALKILEAIVHEGVLAAAWNWQPPDNFLTEVKKVVQSGLGPEVLYNYLLSVLPVANSWPITREERESRAALENFLKIEKKLQQANKPSKIYQLLKGTPLPALKILTAIKNRSIIKKIELFLNELNFVQPALKASDLMALGITPGPLMGKITRELLYAKLDKRVSTPAEELILVKSLLQKVKGRQPTADSRQ